MAEGGVELPSSKFNCSICLEIYKKPKLLPCYHTFCEVCLEQYVSTHARDKKFECPLCRKTIDLPSDGVNSYQTNFYIDPSTCSNVSEDVVVRCDVCGPEQPADHTCVECDENFCPPCTKAHATMKMTRNHQILELKSSTPDTKRKLKIRVFCSKHPSHEILVVCKKCDQLLCVLCTITGHKDHDNREIAEEAEVIKTKLSSKIGSAGLANDLEKLHQDIANLEKFTVDLKEDLNSEILDVQDQCKKLHAAVDAGKRETEIQLKDKYQLRIKASTAMLQELKSIYHSYNATKEMALALIEKETEVGLVQKGPTLFDQIDKYLQQQPTVVRDKLKGQKLFHPRKVDTNAITCMIGTVDESKSQTEISTLQTSPTSLVKKITPLKGRLRQISSFQLSNVDTQVESIAPISNGRAWVYYYQGGLSCVLYQLDITGLLLQELKVSKFCSSVATDDEENCIVTCPDNSSIMRVTTRGKEEVLLEGIGRDPPRDAVFRSKTLSTSGQDELLFCTYRNLWSKPYKMLSMPTKLSMGHTALKGMNTDPMTGNICMSDYSSGEAIILDKNGKQIGTYKDAVEMFRPDGICFDNQGCVLVANSIQNHVRRLKPDGSLVEILFENACEGCGVVVMAADKYNRVWLGGNRGQIRVYEVV